MGVVLRQQASARPWSRRRVLAIALGAMFVALLVATLVMVRHRSAGPIEGVNGWAGTTVGAKPGETDSFGIALQNRSGRELVLDRVVPLGVTGQIAVVGMAIVHHPLGITGSDRGYPPKGTPRLNTVEGWRVAPHEQDDELLVGVQLNHRGSGVIRAVRVDYHSGWHRYRRDFDYSIGINEAVKPPA